MVPWSTPIRTPTLYLGLLIGSAFIHTRAAGAAAILPRQSITSLSSAQIASFTPFTHYASTGYCAPSTTISWTCGANCDANPTFKPVASGGDGESTQFWFVGYDPTLNTVIVSHQGTDTSEILPLVEDANIVRESLDSSLFPGVDTSIGVHSGFAHAQAQAANEVLAAVTTAMNKFGTLSVTTTGHSLGAAISLLDAIFIPLHIPEAQVRFIGYGLPRVGNQAFANYVDARPIPVTHINNREDLVPILPGRFLGYHHPSGEVHIEDSGSWVACPGQDNTSSHCTAGDVSNIFEGDTSDHDGPYNGVEIGC